MITLEQLETLVAVEKYGTLSAAAQALHLSQPSMTRKIAQLEQELGVELFDHGVNRLVINAIGQAAIKEAKVVLNRVALMEKNIANAAKKNQHLFYGTSTTMGSDVMERLIHEFGFTGQIHHQLIEDENQLKDDLRQGKYDFIIVHNVDDLDPSLHALAFVKEQLSLKVPLDHPLAKYKTVSIDDLKGQNVLLYRDIGFWYEWARKYMKETNFLTMDKWKAFQDMAGLGSFPSFVSDLAGYGIQQDKVVIPLSDESCKANYYMVYPLDSMTDNNSQLTHLIHYVEKECKL